MKLKTSELIGPALDYAVAVAEKLVYQAGAWYRPATPALAAWRIPQWCPSTDGSQGVEIIEREGIHWINNGRSDRAGKPYKWLATKDFSDPLHSFYGPTILVACLRCYVAAELGDEVDVPEELMP